MRDSYGLRFLLPDMRGELLCYGLGRQQSAISVECENDVIGRHFENGMFRFVKYEAQKDSLGKIINSPPPPSRT